AQLAFGMETSLLLIENLAFALDAVALCFSPVLKSLGVRFSFRYFGSGRLPPPVPASSEPPLKLQEPVAPLLYLALLIGQAAAVRRQATQDVGDPFFVGRSVPLQRGVGLAGIVAQAFQPL